MGLAATLQRIFLISNGSEGGKKKKKTYHQTLSFMLYEKANCPFAFYSFANNSQGSHCLGDCCKNWAEFQRAVSSHPKIWGPECSLNIHYFTPINLLIHLGILILMPGTSLNNFSQLRWPSFSNRIPPCLCTHWLLTFPYRRHIDVFIKCPPFTHTATKFRIYCSFYSAACNKYQLCSFPDSFSPPQIFQALHHHRPTYKVPTLGKLLGKHL